MYVTAGLPLPTTTRAIVYVMRNVVQIYHPNTRTRVHSGSVVLLAY